MKKLSYIIELKKKIEVKQSSINELKVKLETKEKEQLGVSAELKKLNTKYTNLMGNRLKAQKISKQSNTISKKQSKDIKLFEDAKAAKEKAEKQKIQIAEDIENIKSDILKAGEDLQNIKNEFDEYTNLKQLVNKDVEKIKSKILGLESKLSIQEKNISEIQGEKKKITLKVVRRATNSKDKKPQFNGQEKTRLAELKQDGNLAETEYKSIKEKLDICKNAKEKLKNIDDLEFSEIISFAKEALGESSSH